MKRSLLTGFMLMSLHFAFAQNKDAVLGKWQSEHGNGQIQIYRTGDKYFGKLIWLKEPNDTDGKPKHDIHNPDKRLRSQPIIGLEVLKHLEYEGNNVWDNGSVYTPKSGRSFSCRMTLLSNDKLNIKGFMGFSFIAKSETWTRIP